MKRNFSKKSTDEIIRKLYISSPSKSNSSTSKPAPVFRSMWGKIENAIDKATPKHERRIVKKASDKFILSAKSLLSNINFSREELELSKKYF